jgi:hypothetical protein
MALSYGRAGRLTPQNGDFWPGQYRSFSLTLQQIFLYSVFLAGDAALATIDPARRRRLTAAGYEATRPGPPGAFNRP